FPIDNTGPPPFPPFGAMTMPRNARVQAVLLIAAALLAASCEDNAKPNLPAPEKTSPPPAKSPLPAKDEEKKSDSSPGDADSKDAKESKSESNPALLDPALASDEAPESFQVKFATTKGDFVIEVTRDWAPNGADRFYN